MHVLICIYKHMYDKICYIYFIIYDMYMSYIYTYGKKKEKQRRVGNRPERD